MNSKYINCYQATAALTRAFFEAFTMGIMDSLYPTEDTDKKYNLRNIKQAMLEHYEQIADAFFMIMFTVFIRLNYRDVEDAQQRLIKEFANKQPTMPDYLRFACKTQKLYDAMVTEYKQNFDYLLRGKFYHVPEYLKQYTHGSQLSVADEPLAINLMVRTILKAYTTGMKLSGTKKLSLHQPSILRLLIVNINLLINNSQLKAGQAELNDLFMAACGNETNMNVMLNTLDETYKELIKEEGIISDNDKSN
uniref:RteC protein n=2 Tax=unclassified Prevotella TaxID=2638335 RepID=A0AB33IUT4_9BACT